jgi:hypothetical protein
LVSLEKLAEQSAVLGEERLSRGAILVLLTGSTPGVMPHLVASAESPLDGYERPSALDVVPYADCLPLLEPALAGAQLSTPMNPASGGRVYWLAREIERVNVIATDGCGAPAGAPLQRRSAGIARESVPLLTFDTRVSEEPLVLVVLEQPGASAEFRLLKLVQGDLEGQAVEVEGAGSSRESVALYDSFEQRRAPRAAGDPRTVARRVRGKVIEHLLWVGDAWRFAACAEPQSDVYRVEQCNCSKPRKGDHVQLRQEHLDSLDQVENGRGWIVRKPWSQEGDTACLLHVLEDPCGKVERENEHG